MRPNLRSLCLITCLASASGAGAANVYRCPDGSYADKPCGEGQRVITTTRRASSDSAAERACLAQGEEAFRIARQKAAGLPVNKAIAGVDNLYIPFEEKAARKKLVVTVYQTPGTPAEARSLVEADCVAKEQAAQAERQAKAEREAREAAAAAKNQASQKAQSDAPGAAPAPTTTAALSAEQCKQLKQTMAAMSAASAAGLDDGTPGKPNAAQADAQKQFKQFCP